VVARRTDDPTARGYARKSSNVIGTSSEFRSRESWRYMVRQTIALRREIGSLSY
jgi:hypothetical protein